MKEANVIWVFSIVLLLLGAGMTYLIEKPPVGQAIIYQTDKCTNAKQNFFEFPELVYQACGNECVDKNTGFIEPVYVRNFLGKKWIDDEFCVKL